MPRSSVKLELIEDHKKRITVFINRLKGLKKKVSELAKLCNVPVALICNGPSSDQTVCWPDNCIEVLNKYLESPPEKRGKYLLDLETLLGPNNVWSQRLRANARAVVEAKLVEVNQRLQLLKDQECSYQDLNPSPYFPFKDELPTELCRIGTNNNLWYNGLGMGSLPSHSFEEKVPAELNPVGTNNDIWYNGLGMGPLPSHPLYRDCGYYYPGLPLVVQTVVHQLPEGEVPGPSLRPGACSGFFEGGLERGKRDYSRGSNSGNCDGVGNRNTLSDEFKALEDRLLGDCGVECGTSNEELDEWINSYMECVV